jgi:hypothetical protein
VVIRVGIELGRRGLCSIHRLIRSFIDIGIDK